MKNMIVCQVIFLVSAVVSAMQIAEAGKPKELNARTYAANDIEVQIVSAETQMLLLSGENEQSNKLFTECKDINIGTSNSDPYDVNSVKDTSTTIVIKGLVMNQCR